MGNRTSQQTWSSFRPRGEVNKKALQIVAIVVMLVVAGILAYRSLARANAREGSDQKIPFICASCKYEFTRTLADVGIIPVPQTCPKCGKPEASRATECPNCNKLMLPITQQDDYVCPLCKSKIGSKPEAATPRDLPVSPRGDTRKRGG
jgi:hypothetical protein